MAAVDSFFKNIRVSLVATAHTRVCRARSGFLFVLCLGLLLSLTFGQLEHGFVARAAESPLLSIGQVDIEFIVGSEVTEIAIEPDELQALRALPLEVLANDLIKAIGRTGKYKNISVAQEEPTLQTQASPALAQSVMRIRWLVSASVQQHVADLSFAGLGFLEDISYRAGLKSQVGTPFQQQNIDFDVLRLEAKLHDNGYLNARVAQVKTSLDSQGDVKILLEVEKGRPCRIAEILVEPEQSVLGFITSPVEPGSICDKSSINEALERERNRLRTEGFLEADLAFLGLNVSDDKERAVVRLRIVRGPRTRIEIINLATGSVSDELSQGKNSVQPLELAYFSQEDLRTEIHHAFQKRGFVNAVVTGPLKLVQGDTVVLRFSVQPGGPVFIGKVEIRGLLPFPAKDLLERLEVTPGFFSGRKPFVEAQLLKLQESVQAAYFDVGYADAQVDPAVVSYSADGKLAHLVFRVDAGDQYVVRDLVFQGKPASVELEKEVIMRTLGPSIPVTQSRLKELADVIRLRLMSQGYAYAQVKGKLNVLPAEGGKKPTQIIMEIMSGPVVKIGGVFAEGELYGKRERVISESGLESGELFTPEALERARLRILKHDLFGNVVVEPLNGGSLERQDTVVDVVIRTQSRGGYTLGLQPGWGSIKGYRFNVDFAKNNLTSSGLRFNSSAAISQEKQQRFFGDTKQLLGRKITAGLVEPLMRIGDFVTPFDLTLLTGVEVAAQALSNRYYETFEGGLAWKPFFLGRSWIYSLKLAHEWSKILSRGLEPLEALDRPSLRIHEIVLGVGLDTRNNVEWPTGGSITELQSSHARFGLASEVQYDRISMDVSSFFPVWDRLSGAFSFGAMRLSNVVNLRQETVTAPGSRRASLSGKALVRGFPETGPSVGPLVWLNLQPPLSNKDLNCGPTLRAIGATNLLYLKSELRYRSPWLTEMLGFAWFVDTGSSYFTEHEARKIQERLDSRTRVDDGIADPNECEVRQAKLVTNEDVSLRERTVLRDYFKSSYISTGFGVRVIIPSLASVNLDWGFPLYDPADANGNCKSVEDASAARATEAPVCVKRRATDKVLGIITLPGAFHIGVGATF